MPVLANLEVGAVIVTGDVASVSVSATVNVAANNKRGQEGEEVVFFLGTEEVGRQTTDELGHANLTITNIPVLDTAQQLSVAARLTGDTTKKSKNFTVPAKEVKATKEKPVATRLRLDRDEGTVYFARPDVKRYNIHVFATTDDRTPVPGTKVTCCFQGEQQIQAIPDDPMEILVIVVEIRGYGRQSDFVAQLPNGTSACLPIYGPRKIKPIPEPLPGYSSFGAALKRMLKGGQK